MKHAELERSVIFDYLKTLATEHGFELHEHKAEETAPTAARMSKHIGEVLSRRSEVNWLKREEIERGVIAVMSGPRGSYKSSVSLNWIGHVCAELREPVLWCTAEGSGTDRRFNAWLQTNAPDVDPNTLPLRVIERRYDFFKDNGDILKLSAELAAMSTEYGAKPALCVCDTYSKYNGGLRENENDDAKKFIANIDRNVRAPYGCTVLLITHTGLSDTGRARGASALEADSDAAYVVSNANGVIRMTRQRFKDSPELPDLVLKPTIVDLGYTDADGTPVTACVAEPVDNATAARSATIRPLKGNQKIVYEALQQLAPNGQRVSIAALLDEAIKRKGTDTGGKSRLNDVRIRLQSALTHESLQVRGVHVSGEEAWIQGVIDSPDSDWLETA